MDIHIQFETSGNELLIKNVIKRDINSDTYVVKYIKDGLIAQETFNTKDIKCVVVDKVDYSQQIA